MSIMRLYFVTGNNHKVEEIRAIFEREGLKIEIVKVSGQNKLEIQHNDLEQIVLFAIKSIQHRIEEPFIIEDAGLFIRRLRGFPGPYSHYAYSTIGIRGILKLMEGEEDRYAEFKSVIGLSFGGEVKLFVGLTRGKIARAPRGHYGFGFDPIFIPEGQSKTYAEMSLGEKNMVSHRAKATLKLIEFLRSKL